jgi:hypothetical protein
MEAVTIFHAAGAAGCGTQAATMSWGRCSRERSGSVVLTFPVGSSGGANGFGDPPNRRPPFITPHRDQSQPFGVEQHRLRPHAA